MPSTYATTASCSRTSCLETLPGIAAYDGGEDDLVERVLTLMEKVAREGDAKATELVCVSFVENIRPHDDPTRSSSSSMARTYARILIGGGPSGE